MTKGVRRTKFNEHGVTEKEEKFCYYFVESGKKTESYRKAYACDNMSVRKVVESSGKLLMQDRVVGRIEELRRVLREVSEVNLASLSSELEGARRLAMETGNPSAAVAAITNKAKLHGLMVDKQNITIKRPGDMSDEELERVLQKAPTPTNDNDEAADIAEEISQAKDLTP